MGKKFTTQEIRYTLQTSGVKFQTIEAVSNSMFRIEINNGTTRYAKIVPPTKIKTFERLVKLGSHIGMPQSRLVHTQPAIHLMHPARGKTLSGIIPIYILPGVYTMKSSQLKNGIYQLGTYLGRLHSTTHSGETIIDFIDTHLDEQDAVSSDGVSPLLKDWLAPDTISDIEDILNNADPIQCDKSIIHGDIRLFHVYFSNSDVELIDFDSTTKDAGIIDTVSFECSLRLMTSRLPWRTQEKYDILLNRFYKGYFEHCSGDVMCKNITNILRLIKYCSILLYYVERIKKNRSERWLSTTNATQFFDTKLLVRLIRNELAKISTSQSNLS